MSNSAPNFDSFDNFASFCRVASDVVAAFARGPFGDNPQHVANCCAVWFSDRDVDASASGPVVSGWFAGGYFQVFSDGNVFGYDDVPGFGDVARFHFVNGAQV